jgi:hypothetical protein
MERLLTAAFWRKLARGELALLRSAAELMRRLVTVGSAPLLRSARRHGTSDTFQDSMLVGLKSLPGRCLLVLSGRDLTAQEFDTFCSHHREWRATLADAGRVETVRLREADHTFSEEPMRSEIVRLTKDFVLSLIPSRVSGDVAHE